MESISATIEVDSIQERSNSEDPDKRPRLDDPKEFSIIRDIYLVKDDDRNDVGARHRKSQLGTNQAR